MNRMREKLFYVWSNWAQRERRLKMMREDLEEWLRTRLKRRTVDAMFDIGYKVISKRITKLRRLKEVAQDRRVVICAYALMRRDDHVMMVGDSYVLVFSYPSLSPSPSPFAQFTLSTPDPTPISSSPPFFLLGGLLAKMETLFCQCRSLESCQLELSIDVARGREPSLVQCLEELHTYKAGTQTQRYDYITNFLATIL